MDSCHRAAEYHHPVLDLETEHLISDRVIPIRMLVQYE